MSTSSDRDEGDMVVPQPDISLFPDDNPPTIRSVYAPGPYKPIEDPCVAYLLQYYIHNIAPWVRGRSEKKPGSILIFVLA